MKTLQIDCPDGFELAVSLTEEEFNYPPEEIEEELKKELRTLEAF